MSEVKMPEPDTHCFDSDTGLDVWSHSKTQLKQYGYDRAREAVEMAAKVCDIDVLTNPINVPGGEDGIELANSLAFHIRALAKEIK